MARLNRVESFRGTTKTEDGLLTCGACGKKIQKGDSYLWWANRAPGSYASVRRIRCPEHPPSIADPPPGRRGQLMAIQDDVDRALGDASSVEDFEAAASSGAEQLEDLASELRESSENMEQGFGHPTSQSDELAEKADGLESVAQELSILAFDDKPDEPEDDAEEDEREEAESAIETWHDNCMDQVQSELGSAEV